MKAGWREVLLEDVSDDITVGFVGSMSTEYVASGITFLRSQNVIPLKIDTSDVKFISRKFHEKISKSRLVPGDVIIVRTGKPGACAVVPYDFPEANCSDLVIVRPSKLLEARFLCYYINTSAQAHISAHLVGAVQQHFNVGSARKLRLKLPPLETQRAIASILGALDDKIELNRRMNRTLEATARALFKSWFVDFDPVHANAEGRVLEGLSADVQALFPSSFEGGVPSGWRKGTLDELTGFQSGYSFKSSDWQAEGIPVVKIGSVKPGVIDLEQVSYVSDHVAEKAKKFRLQKGDLLIGMTGYVGEVGLVPPTHTMPLLNQRVGKFVLPNSDAPQVGLVYCVTRDHKFKTFVASVSHGTAQANVSSISILKYPILIATDSVVKEFNLFVQTLIDKILSLHGESVYLAAARDSLLPKLLSGELAVRDVQDSLEVIG